VSIQRKPEIQSISTLGIRQQYAQVKEFASIKRAANPHYAKLPEMQNTRWHIWFDGKEVVSAVCSGHGKKSKWEVGPTVAAADFSTGDGIVSGLGSLLSSHKGGVGVIVHMADCSVLNYVKDSYDSPDKAAAVRVMSVENPASVILGDVQSASEGHRWRPISISGAKKGRFGLFRLSSRDLTAGLKLAQLDGPFSVGVRSAHMEALVVGQAMAGVLDAENAPAAAFGRILVYYYRRSTMIAVYNTEGMLSELRLLPQAEGSVPQTLRNDFSLMLQKAPSPEMLVTVFQCADGADILAEELGSVKSVSGVNVSLQILERQVLPDFCRSAGLPLVLGDTPLPIEFAVEYPDWLGTHAICGKAEEAQMLDMAKADFAQSNAEGAASVPLPIDLKMFLLGKALRLALFLGIIGFGIWGGFKVWSYAQSEEWNVDLAKVEESSQKVASLKAEETKVAEVKKLMSPSPDANFVMELGLALFPDSNETLITRMAFTMKEVKDDPDAITLDMTFSGQATRRGLALLNRLRGQDYLASIVMDAGERQGMAFEKSLENSPPKFSFSETSKSQTSKEGENTDPEKAFLFEFTGAMQVKLPLYSQKEETP
jgi:hypothetical protein